MTLTGSSSPWRSHTRALTIVHSHGYHIWSCQAVRGILKKDSKIRNTFLGSKWAPTDIRSSCFYIYLFFSWKASKFCRIILLVSNPLIFRMQTLQKTELWKEKWPRADFGCNLSGANLWGDKYGRLLKFGPSTIHIYLYFCKSCLHL